MTYKGKWPGTWASICDVCGFRFPSNKLRLRWDGLMACSSDWEARHPQDFIQIRQEKIAPDWVRPVAPDQFVQQYGLIIMEDNATLISTETGVLITTET